MASFVALPKHIKQMSKNDAIVANPQINTAIIPGTEKSSAITRGNNPFMADKGKYKEMILDLVIGCTSQVSDYVEHLKPLLL